MDLPFDKVFGITELAAIIAADLKQRDIAALLVTNKRMYSRCIPLLFRHIDLVYTTNGCNIFASVEYTLSLARNIHHVRSLTFGWPDLAYYFNGVLAYLDTLPPAAAAAVTSSLGPDWLCAADPRVFRLIPIMPVTSLTKLVVQLNPLEAEHTCPYFLPSCHNYRAALAQACWMAQLNPGLIELSLTGHFVIYHDPDIQLLSRIINGLKNLKYLQLHIYC